MTETRLGIPASMDKPIAGLFGLRRDPMLKPVPQQLIVTCFSEPCG